MRLLAIAMMVLALAACDPVRHSSDEASRVGKKFVDDTKTSWRDLFTYHRPRNPQDPQTRFCYQMQSDVVCYDTPQTHMTSKLVGYQDGENISYIQKGGGSMGVSTAQSQVFTQTSPYADDAAPYGDVISDDTMMPVETGDRIRVDETNAPAPTPNPTSCTPGMTPFECRESQYVPNADVGR